MITDIVSESVLLAIVALVSMPLLAKPVRASFRPVELTRFNASTMSSGLLLLVIALVACAIPVVATLWGAGGVDRHFFPGDTAVGWTSAAVFSALLVAFVVGYLRSVRTERRLTVEPSIGTHVQLDGFDLVILDSEARIAYAVDRSQPQIVMTTGLIESLSVPELVSVVEHEAAHITLGHRRHLRLLGLLEPLSRIATVRRLIDSYRLALEQAADARTTDHKATRTALLRLSGIAPAAGVAAFTASDIAERITVLGQTAPAPGSARAVLYVLSTSLALLSAVTLTLFWF